MFLKISVKSFSISVISISWRVFWQERRISTMRNPMKWWKKLKKKNLQTKKRKKERKKIIGRGAPGFLKTTAENTGRAKLALRKYLARNARRVKTNWQRRTEKRSRVFLATRDSFLPKFTTFCCDAIVAGGQKVRAR